MHSAETTKILMIRFIPILLFLAISSPLAGDQTKTLTLRQEENGYEDAEDVSLDYQLLGRWEHNFGAAPTMAVYCSGGKVFENETGNVFRNENGWVKMALLRFKLPPIPSGAKITSIRLVLHVVSSPPREVPNGFELHNLVKKDLVFGSSLDIPENGAVSPSWSKTASEGWGKGHELMPRLGEDIESYAFAEATLEAGATVLTFENLPLPQENDWMTGFVLYPVTRSHDGGVQVMFASSEHPDPLLRPTLEIQYQ